MKMYHFCKYLALNVNFGIAAIKVLQLARVEMHKAMMILVVKVVTISVSLNFILKIHLDHQTTWHQPHLSSKPTSKSRYKKAANKSPVGVPAYTLQLSFTYHQKDGTPSFLPPCHSLTTCCSIKTKSSLISAIINCGFIQLNTTPPGAGFWLISSIFPPLLIKFLLHFSTLFFFK